MEFRISERFRLEIRWERVKYGTEGTAELVGCYLSGPVISEVAQMNNNDYMNLDFQHQYKVIINSYYIARFSWAEATHKENKIFLFDVKLINKHVNSVPKLNDDDYIVIDTSDHEDEKHELSLVYKAYLVKEDGTLYNF